MASKPEVSVQVEVGTMVWVVVVVAVGAVVVVVVVVVVGVVPSGGPYKDWMPRMSSSPSRNEGS